MKREERKGKNEKWSREGHRRHLAHLLQEEEEEQEERWEIREWEGNRKREGEGEK